MFAFANLATLLRLLHVTGDKGFSCVFMCQFSFHYPGHDSITASSVTNQGAKIDPLYRSTMCTRKV
jgi:hypothetical protein